jgi:shikimate kinase
VIVLIGFMGAGKTTVGRLLARRLALPFLDSDQVIVARAGRSIAEIFSAAGEAAFRTLERQVVLDLLSGPDAVLALGGGAVQDSATREAVAACTAVHLAVTEEEVRRRIGGDTGRPLLAGADLGALLRSRQTHYDQAATIRVDTDRRPAQAVADEVLAHLEAGGRQTVAG